MAPLASVLQGLPFQLTAVVSILAVNVLKALKFEPLTPRVAPGPIGFGETLMPASGRIVKVADAFDAPSEACTAYGPAASEGTVYEQLAKAPVESLLHVEVNEIEAPLNLSDIFVLALNPAPLTF